MRNSLSTFIDRCFDIKVFLAVGSYELHDYEDGDYADFKVSKINDPKTLSRIIGNLDYRILSDDGFVKIRVFEDFKEW